MRALLVLQGVATTLSADLDLGPLLRRVTMAAVRLCAADASALYLVDGTRTQLTTRAVETARSAAESGAFNTRDGRDTLDVPALERITDDSPGAAELGMPFGAGIAGHVARTGAFVLITDASNETRFSAEDVAHDERVLGIQLGHVLVVPILHKGRVIGALEVAQLRSRTCFDAHSLDFARTLAAQAAVAVANAQLYSRLRDERDRIIQAREDERKHLGRTLRDGPTRQLAELAMILERAEQAGAHDPEEQSADLRDAHDLAMRVARDLRMLLFDLRPLVLETEQGGLVAALEQLVVGMRGGAGPHMRLDARYSERLPHAVELAVFAIIQEAVHNVLTHAHATTCAIELRERPEKLVALVRDDGDGFDMRAVQAEYESRDSWGLVSMLERAALIDAKFSISSQPGKGTIVSLDVPRVGPIPTQHGHHVDAGQRQP